MLVLICLAGFVVAGILTLSVIDDCHKVREELEETPEPEHEPDCPCGWQSPENCKDCYPGKERWLD